MIYLDSRIVVSKGLRSVVVNRAEDDTVKTRNMVSKIPRRLEGLADARLD